MSQTGQSARAKQAFVPLSKSHPLLAAQWHPTKNGNVSPDDLWANYSDAQPNQSYGQIPQP